MNSKKSRNDKKWIDKKSGTITEVEITSHDWKKGNLMLDFSVPYDYDFMLKRPSRSRLDSIFERIEEGAQKAGLKISIDEKRVNELFEHWLQIEKDNEAKVDQLVADFVGTGPNQIYGKLEGTLPGPYNLASDRMQQRFGSSAFEKGTGYGFVRVHQGKKYHVNCFSSLQL